MRRSDAKLYAATTKVWRIGQAVIERLDLPAVAERHMRGQSESTGVTIYLAVPEGLPMDCISKFESTEPIRRTSKMI